MSAIDNPVYALTPEEVMERNDDEAVERIIASIAFDESAARERLRDYAARLKADPLLVAPEERQWAKRARAFADLASSRRGALSRLLRARRNLATQARRQNDHATVRGDRHGVRVWMSHDEYLWLKERGGAMHLWRLMVEARAKEASP